jgi:hypothetical protein
MVNQIVTGILTNTIVLQINMSANNIYEPPPRSHTHQST